MPLTPLLVFAASFASAPADGWQTYSNARFAFSICYPAGSFAAEPPPANGDGLIFRANDGATLTAWGSNDALESGLAGERTVDEQRLKGVTYRASGRNWYVLSGRTAARLYYHKTFLDDGRFVSFELSYPAATAAKYSPIVARMQKCFRYARQSY